MTDWLDALLREVAVAAGSPCSRCGFGLGERRVIIHEGEELPAEDADVCPECGRAHGVYVWIPPRKPNASRLR